MCILIGILIYIIGVGALFGFAALLAVVPLQAWMAKCAGDLRRGAVKYTDRRVGLMREIINAILVIKFYAFENSFAKEIESSRR